ncbi:hypothetical protein EDB48_103110 [Vibrio crassostreae]|nr:hypothetical protein EDB48_103110 [Vibrio crassostreae]
MMRSPPILNYVLLNLLQYAVGIVIAFDISKASKGGTTLGEIAQWRLCRLDILSRTRIVDEPEKVALYTDLACKYQRIFAAPQSLLFAIVFYDLH